MTQNDPTPPNMTQRAFKPNSNIAGNGSHVCQHSGPSPLHTTQPAPSINIHVPIPCFARFTEVIAVGPAPRHVDRITVSQSSIVVVLVESMPSREEGRLYKTDMFCAFSRTTLPARRDVVIADRLIEGREKCSYSKHRRPDGTQAPTRLADNG